MTLVVVCAALGGISVAGDLVAFSPPPFAVARPLPPSWASYGRRPGTRPVPRMRLRGTVESIAMFEGEQRKATHAEEGEGQQTKKRTPDAMAGFAWEGNLDNVPAEAGTPLYGRGGDASTMRREADKGEARHKRMLFESAFPADAPACSQHTIQHWSESEGSSGWALVMPDLSEMQRQLESLESRAQALRDRLVEASPCECQERSDMRKQLSSLHQRQFMIRHKMSVYDAENHDPTMLGEGAQAQILLGKDVGSGEKVAIKVVL
eukprot:CAMPEP_0173423860 /NCGR_PEP_ID=MMETSP1357-20121228/3987_1 /TAXON_ID=77926 /ORGANISM="Hemiselmis rufescens, Strain PCC563" /LENGTH=263 /DNA_ID=CAMNT_0014387017 /DNA_START=83 /DNA_END=871 /DNA_ORIENTATION=-